MTYEYVTREYKLIVLMEECSEIIQAAAKCLRFGWDTQWKDHGINHEELEMEIGQALGMIDWLELGDTPIANQARGEKKQRVLRHYRMQNASNR